MNDSDNIMQLLPPYYEGKASEAQRQIVEAWMAKSDRNKEIALEVEHLYRLRDKSIVARTVNTDKALNNVHGAIRHAHIMLWMHRLERAAAVLFLPLVVVSFLQFYHASQPRHVHMLTCTTAPSMTGTVTLPDGTKVSLNAGSTISYPEEFGDTRQVSLSGEAYFAVTKDSHHPFKVNTPCKAVIKVLGTHFNLEAYPEDRQVTATLEEGSIAMSYLGKNGKDRQLLLKPGQSAVYNVENGNATVSDADVTVVTSWKDGRLVFHNTPLTDVLRSVSKRYGIRFIIKNRKAYSTSLTGVVDKQGLEGMLKLLSLATGLHFQINLNSATKCIVCC